MQAELARIVTKTALDIEAGAKVAIQSSLATGRVYGKHQASSPGEAPATDTGSLAASISVVDVSKLTKEVVAGADYAEVLELGGVHMQARPFLSPAVEAVRTSFEAAVSAAIK